MSKKGTTKESPAWLTLMAQHEGAPIALRVRPNADTPANRKQYSQRVVVVHDLDHVNQEGLPESAYNQSLAEFDHAVHLCLEGNNEGLVVLVETFAGRRVYFSYSRRSADPDNRLDDLKSRFPQHKIRSKVAVDDKWEAYEHYRKLFPW